MTKKIILLNAPPRAGKDTAAIYIADKYYFTHLKFAGILKQRTHSLYGFNDQPIDFYEDCKDTPHDDFLGLTPRQAYINVSEKYFKPIHGQDVFGHFLKKEILSSSSNYFIISDSGFWNEAQVLIDTFGVDNVYLIRIAKNNCSFDNDSRSYIFLKNVYTEVIENNSTIYSFYLQIDKIINNIINLDIDGFF